MCGDEWRGAARPPLLSGPIYSSQREYRKMRRRTTKTKEKEKEIELDVSICIEEDLPDDPEVLVSSVRPPRVCVNVSRYNKSIAY